MSSRHRRRRSSPPENGVRGEGDEYRSLATDYHWFHDDRRLKIGCDTPGVRLALHGLPTGARVLDAACGIGIDLIALHRRGFEMTGSDASPEMAAVARQRVATADLTPTPQVVTSTWIDLADHFPPGRFDAVLCIGSSIAHTASPADMTDAFGVFRTLLVPGGQLIIDTRDWDVTKAAGEVVEVEPVVVARDGLRCRRTYRWSTPADGSSVDLDATLEFLDAAGEVEETVTHRVHQRPFPRRELRAALDAAGFTAIALDHVPGDDRYTATARRD